MNDLPKISILIPTYNRPNFHTLRFKKSIDTRVPT